MDRLSCGRVLQKCDKKKKKEKEEEDRISGLPDEVIVEILSRLTLKKAMSSSILSRRWRYLWTFISSDLSFDPGKGLNHKAFKEEEFVRGIYNYKAKFVGWVNHVLKLHQGPVVDRFRVCFSFDSTYSDVVDNCINFAMKKRIRELELNLTDFHGFGHDHPYCLKLNNNNYTTLNRLTSLRLINVDVSAEVVELFLAKCPLLEELCIVHSTTITNLKIVGLKLKYLDLYRCEPLEKLEIVSAPNLVYFSYSGPKTEVPFQDGVPLLSELCIGDEFCESFLCEAPKHSTYLSQLKKLTIVLPGWRDEDEDFPKYPLKLYNLKQLELRVGITFNSGQLSWLTCLIKSAPILSKFVLKIQFIGSSKAFCYEEYLVRSKKHHHRHQCLKEIEFIGFVGNRTHFKLAVRLLEISVALEKISIDTRHPGPMCGPDIYCDAFADRDVKDREGAKEVAQHLRSHTPQAVNLLIL